MEENLAEVMQRQIQKNIEKFKEMSSKYIQKEKINLWHKYVENYMGYHKRDDIYQQLTDNHIILPIIREIYELGLPINEKSKTLTINAIMFREMQESIKLQKDSKQ